MNRILEQMLSGYNAQTDYDRKNAIKEIVQEIVLCGLSRSDFFQHAAFYGGTALRIFYGLDRFSEDLDFSLIQPDQNFHLSDYLQIVEEEVHSYGLNMKTESKAKTKETFIQSAFVKGNTREQLITFYPDENLAHTVSGTEQIKIKFEVDTDPPAFAGFEHKFRLQPVPYEINLYDMPSLFAGKIHAVLCRGWKNRVKGRDLYDYIFYLSHRTPVNRKHLNARLIDSGYTESELSSEEIKTALKTRFHEIDFQEAKEDVLPFIRNPKALDMWSENLFSQITEDLFFL